MDKGFTYNNLLQISPKISSYKESFVRTIINAKFFLPMNRFSSRMILEGHFGDIAISNIQGITPNFRFYAGGIGNLLGYPYFSQGPKVNNKIIGGKFLATGLAGIKQCIHGNFSTMLYYNSGNASNKIDFSDVNILQAITIGFSCQSLLGSLMILVSKILTSGYKT